MTIDLATVNSVVYWLSLAQKPIGNSEEIAMITLDKNKYVYGIIWNGSGFGDNQLLHTDAQAETTECMGLALSLIHI